MLRQICLERCAPKILRGYHAVKRTSATVKGTAGARDVLPQLVEGSPVNKPSDWKTVRGRLLQHGGGFTEKSVDSMLLNYCVMNGKYDYAKKYIAFLNEERIRPNLGTIGKYFKLFYMMHRDKLTGERDEERILRTYEELRKEYKVLDSITIEQIICGLSVTGHWRECIDLLEEGKATGIPNNLAYNAVVSAAFRNGDDELGWQVFNEMIENDRQPLNVTYEAVLGQLQIDQKSRTNMQRLEKLFETLDNHDLHFDGDVAKKFVDATRQVNIGASLARVSGHGTCSNCKETLGESRLTAKEFSVLKDAFVKEVIVGRDLFCKTTPEELERFKSFVRGMGRFDVVIDGLNTQYSQGVMQSPQAVSTLLVNVIKYFTRQDKTVLLLGRQHMDRLPAKNWSFIQRYSTVFLTHNLSQDDPFILYCALWSGMDTNIVTRDLMRSHLYLLKDKRCKKLFRRWLAQNRLHLVTVQKGDVIFKEPLRYMIAPQRSQSKWHIPYVREATETPKSKQLRLVTFPLSVKHFIFTITSKFQFPKLLQHTGDNQTIDMDGSKCKEAAVGRRRRSKGKEHGAEGPAGKRAGKKGREGSEASGKRRGPAGTESGGLRREAAVSENVHRRRRFAQPFVRPHRPSFERIDQLSRPTKSSLLATWQTYCDVFDYERMRRVIERLYVEFSLTPEEKRACMDRMRRNAVELRAKIEMGSTEEIRRYRISTEHLQQLSRYVREPRATRSSRRTEELARPNPFKVLATWEDHGDTLPTDKRKQFKRKYVDVLVQAAEHPQTLARRPSVNSGPATPPAPVGDRGTQMAREAAYKLVEKGIQRAAVYASEGRPPPVMTRTLVKLSDNIVSILAGRGPAAAEGGPRRPGQRNNARLLLYIADWTARIISDAYFATERLDAAGRGFALRRPRPTAAGARVRDTIPEEQEEGAAAATQTEPERGPYTFEDVPEIDDDFGNEGDWDSETRRVVGEAQVEVKRLTVTDGATEVIHVREGPPKEGPEEDGGKPADLGVDDQIGGDESGISNDDVTDQAYTDISTD